MNVRHLASLAAIVRHGTLSAAARTVSLTQPALTQGLAKIERQVGQPLFHRRAGGMVAMPEALMLATRIEAALAHLGNSRVTTAHVRALIAVADAGSYAGASAMTGLAPPTLHRAIADLSIALRRPVVERRGKGIGLTESGRRTARAFRLARTELMAGLSDLAAMQGRNSGRITIGAMPLSRARLLPSVVVAFHRRVPDIEVRIVEGSRAELIEPLRDGEIDLLLGALRPPFHDDDIVQRPLFNDQPVVLARADHPLAGLVEVSPAALATHPWTISAPGTPLRLLWEQMFARAGVTPPMVPVECGSVITIRQILLASDFLTLLSPHQVAVELEAGWLTQIGAPPAELCRTIGITTRSGWQPTSAQRDFLAEIEQVVSDRVSTSL